MNDKCHHPSNNRVICLLFLLGLGFNTAALEIDSGDIQGSIDTTLTYGHLYRIQSRSLDLIGTANGGNAFSVNNDDGNLNYDPGLVSANARFNTELDIAYKDSFGIFFRGNGFTDLTIENTERTPLSSRAKRLADQNFFIRDLYAWTAFDIGNMPGEIRVGEQVVSWGESTFIQNGINIINPIDVARLRTPGAELREALLPVGMIWGTLGLTSNLSVEAFYQYDQEETEAEPVGTFFSTNDFAPDGGSNVFLGFGDASDLETLLAVSSGVESRPRQGGQFGFALRAFAPELNDTEFGLFFVNYHSRLPLISATTGTAAGITQGATTIGGGNTALGISQYAATANYFLEYPDDIQMLGFSFNTEVGNSGIALQGEYSFKHDVPLQIDDVELLFAALTPLDSAIAGGAALPFNVNQVANLSAASTRQNINGFIERNYSQFQFTATKLFGPILKAQQGVLLGEFAISHVHGMPSKGSLRLNGPGTNTSGNPAHSGTNQGHAGKAAEDFKRFADATSYGYRLAGRLDYNNALFGAINLQPRFSWQHDLQGVSPGPGGNFIQGRKALTLGMTATYQNEWIADISYTGFFGAGRFNLLNDRDFMAFSIKYAF